MKYTLSDQGKVVVGAAVFVCVTGGLALNQFTLQKRVASLEEVPVKVVVEKPTPVVTPTPTVPSFQASGSAVKAAKKS